MPIYQAEDGTRYEDTAPRADGDVVWVPEQPIEEINRGNVVVTAARTRADAISAIERKIAAGAAQAEINAEFLTLLKEQS